jgi:prolyl 4-hydroxylase
MTTLVRFAPALGDWISEQLDQGAIAPRLVEVMRERSMAPEVASAIVDAFVRARITGLPAPVDAVELAEAPRFKGGTSIRTSDRLVRIAARVERPMLALLNNVMSADECSELIEMARPRLQPSTIVDPVTGIDTVTGLRTSLGMFFLPAENPLVATIDKRLADVMNMPLENGEGLQILHYPRGAGSAPHHDYLLSSNAANIASIARSGQRVSTLVAYLNDVPAGGETLFPVLGWSTSPQRGNAVYFEYCSGDGQVEPASLHASNAVEEGEKWVATKWMRAQRFISA